MLLQDSRHILKYFHCFRSFLATDIISTYTCNPPALSLPYSFLSIFFCPYVTSHFCTISHYLSPTPFLMWFSYFKNPFLCLCTPVLPPFHPSISLRLTRQVARTARPESVMRSAMTEGKRDSTTGTFPGLLLIRGAGHAL